MTERVIEDGRVVGGSGAGVPIPDGWQDKFIEEIARTGSSNKASRAVGINRSSAYRERRRNPEFEAAWEAARVQFDSLSREEQMAVNSPYRAVARLAEDGHVLPHVSGAQIPDGWQDFFIDKFKETHLLGVSANATGISKVWLRDYRKTHPEFEARVQEIIESEVEIMEQVVFRRAVDGSDQLAMFYLRANKPEKYRENVHHDHNHQVAGSVELEILDGRQPIQIEAQKRREAARALLDEGVIDLPEEAVSEVPDDLAAAS